MADAPKEQLIRAVHDSGRRMVIAVTGGGSRAICELLSVGGASRSVLAGVVPYCQAALVEWLGGTPDEFCSGRTARAMAMAAFERAKTYDPAGNVIGIACTASLASDRPKRGPHRAHMAYQTATTTATESVELEKGARDRAGEESTVAAVLLNLVAQACGVARRMAAGLAEREMVQTAQFVAPAEWQELLAAKTRKVPLGAARAEASPAALFPGAFNPLHEGHKKMAALARSILGCEVAFEMSIANVDKPTLDFMEIDERVRQFTGGEALWLSRAALFAEKAELFPGATFVVGADTIERIGQARYYDGEPAMEAAISRIASFGCRFLVFGRQVEGRFCTLSDLTLPGSLAAICQEVPENAFRNEISSTELRRRQLRD